MGQGPCTLAFMASVRLVNRELIERVVIVSVIVRLIDGFVQKALATATVVSIIDHTNQESVCTAQAMSGQGSLRSWVMARSEKPAEKAGINEDRARCAAMLVVLWWKQFVNAHGNVGGSLVPRHSPRDCS